MIVISTPPRSMGVSFCFLFSFSGEREVPPCCFFLLASLKFTPERRGPAVLEAKAVGHGSVGREPRPASAKVSDAAKGS